MITYVKGSLFESPAMVLVNTVNTVGVMGKGIAKTFKEIYPEMFSQYQRLCEKKQFQIGRLWLYKTNHKWIVNFPTKIHWRQPSKAEYVEGGLKKFVSTYSSQGITSIAFPQLGCGNGELDWEEVVQPLMTKYLESLPIDIFIYEYDRDFFLPEHEDIEAMTAWLRSEPRALAFTEMWTDLCNLIGAGLNLSTWDGAADFKVIVTSRPEHGLQIQVRSKSVWEFLTGLLSKIVPYKWQPRIIGPGDILIPQEAMLDLWQNIRDYGFCVPRIMPAGLDIMAPYVLAVMARLDYMKRVELSTTTSQMSGLGEAGLQLFARPVAQLSRPSQSIYAVHSV